MPMVKTNGIEMHYEEYGQGDPLVLIMGLGTDGSAWEEHVEAYEKHFRCIVPDNRGTGQSEATEGPYTTVMMADDAAGLMAALDIDRAHVSGISMGGAIGQELALRHPERVRSLVVTSTWPKCDPYTVNIFQNFRALAETTEPRTSRRMVYLWIFAPGTHANSPDDLAQREEKSLANPHPTPLPVYQAHCDACITHDTVDRLGDIAAPTLVVVGDEDRYTPMHYSELIAERIPDAQLHVLSGCSHACHWEKLDEYNAATLAFLKAH